MDTVHLYMVWLVICWASSIGYHVTQFYVRLWLVYSLLPNNSVMFMCWPSTSPRLTPSTSVNGGWRILPYNAVELCQKRWPHTVFMSVPLTPQKTLERKKKKLLWNPKSEAVILQNLNIHISQCHRWSLESARLATYQIHLSSPGFLTDTWAVELRWGLRLVS